MLSLQILWSEKCDGALAKVAASAGASDFTPVQGVLDSVQNMLNVLAESVLHEQPPVRRKKIEHLVNSCSMTLYYYSCTFNIIYWQSYSSVELGPQLSK